MAQQKGQRDLLTRLSDAGEEALSRVTSSSATTRLLETVSGMRDRLDEMQKKVRGLDALEQRVKKLEQRVDELAKTKRATASTRRRAPTKRTTTSRSTTRKKPPT
jgi:uncharacterized protein YoxC